MSPTRPTRTRLRSSSTQPYSLDQCIRTIDDQFRRPRNPSAPGRREGGSTPAGGASDPRRGASENASGNASGTVGGASGDIPIEIPLESGASNREDNTNRVALNIWDQLLYTNEVMNIIGRCPFTLGLQNLLNVQQLEEAMELVRKEILDRKAKFIRTKDTDIPRLRLALQEMFTKTVIRHVRGELGIQKENVTTRINELESQDQQVAETLAIREGAANALSNSIKAAQDGIDALHERVTHRLDGVVLVDLVVGTADHTMSLLGELLNNIVDNGTIGLPEIIEQERGANEDQEIYRSDFDKIPQDVKNLFTEAAKLVLQATQAKHEESDALADYTLACTKLETTEQTGPKLHEAQTKLKEIIDFEELARRIMIEGTFWKYERVAAPGENDKFQLDNNTLTKAIEELARISKILEDASFDKDHKSLEKMVTTAKDYVKKIRANLPEYSNVAPLTRAVIYTEATITSCEDVIARDTGRLRRTVSHGPSTETVRSPSRNRQFQELDDRRRARGAGKNKELDIPDYMDKIAKLKMATAHASLSSTRAGQHTVQKSMAPISTVVGRPDGGDDDPSDDDSDYDDDDDNRDRGRRGRDRDDDEGSRRGTKRKRSQSMSRKRASKGSGPVMGAPKMPGLDPRNYFWNGKSAFLRYYIEKWKKLLDPQNYSPAQAVNFMLSCVPINKKHLISDCSTLDEVLKELAMHTTESTTYLLNTVEAMKAYRKCTTYKEDRIMLDFFEESLSNITKLNSAYVLDYLTAQVMCNKLSTITMRTKYIDMLSELKFDTADNHRLNNYLSTMRQVIIKCKVEIKNMIDVDQGDSSNGKQIDNASVYSTQVHGNNDGYRGKGRGGFHNYKTNGRPINQDERGDLLFDYDGNPIDASKQFDTAFALQSSTMETPKPDRGRGAPRGNRGSN